MRWPAVVISPLRRVMMLVLAGVLLATLLVPFVRATTTVGGIATYNLNVKIADANVVIFVYPGTSTGGKPAGMFAAWFTDWVAMGILIGLESNVQYEVFDNSTVAPLSVNTATGQPGASNKPIVTVGGVLVHSQVHYLETVASISPVYYAQDATWRYFKKRSDNSVLASMLLTNTGTSSDYFVIYTVVDTNGNTYYVFYGFHYRGSQAATHLLLAWVQTVGLFSHTGSYEVWRWDDANDGSPDTIVNPPGPCVPGNVCTSNSAATDTYTQVASG